MKRLTIEVSDEQHQAIKAMAVLKRQTVKEYTLACLFPPQPDETQAMQALETLLRQRIAAAEQGEISARSFDDIVTDELRENSQP